MIQNNQEKEILKNSNFYKVSSLFKKEYSYLIDEKNSFSISNFIDNEENLNQEFEYKFKNNLKFKNYLNKNIYNKTLPIEIFKTIFEKDVSWDEAIDYYAFNFSNPSLDYFVKKS